MNNCIYIFIILLFLDTNAEIISKNSQEFTKNSDALNEYLIQAASNNQELRAAFDQWKAALEVILEVDVLPDPRFTFKYFIEPLETRTGPLRASFALTQTFPWMGKLNLKGLVAQQLAYVYKAKFDQLLLEIYLKVKKAYFEFAYLSQAIKITKEVLGILRYVDNVAHNGYSSGDVRYSEVIRTQVELGKVEDQLRSLQDLIKPSIAKLNAAMNLPINAPLKIPQTIPSIHVSVSDKILIKTLKENNPQLLAYSYLAKSDDFSIKLAKKEFYPDFTFGIETIAVGSARTPGIPDSGKYPIIAYLSMNIPLWQSNRNASVRKFEKKKKSALEQHRGLEENLLADLELALYKYRDSIRKIDLYGQTLVPKAKESLAVTLSAFETSRKNFIDLIDTERTLLEIELSYKRALADQGIYLAEIEALTGSELKNLEKKGDL